MSQSILINRQWCFCLLLSGHQVFPTTGQNGPSAHDSHLSRGRSAWNHVIQGLTWINLAKQRGSPFSLLLYRISEFSGSSGALQLQDGGLIPSLAQWVQDLAMPQVWCRSKLQVGSDPWPGNSICRRVAKKEREKIKKNLKRLGVSRYIMH